MSIGNRLNKLEAEFASNTPDHSGSKDRLLKKLASITKRLENTPTEEALKDCAPITVAALVYAMRLDEPVLHRAREYATRDGLVGDLFRSLLDAIAEVQEAEVADGSEKTDTPPQTCQFSPEKG